MEFKYLIVSAFIGALIVQLVTFGYALAKKRIDAVDVVWGLSFIAAVIALQLSAPSTSLWALVTEALVLIWGSRLSWHIYHRFRRTTKQDERYTTLMAHWPRRFMPLQLFVKIFLLQAILATLISLPVIVVHYHQPQVPALALLGLLLWCTGFICEAVADKQLKDFLANPGHGELMTGGLWHYSRHPNYFGEVTMWWGLAVIAAATSLWWPGFIGAVTITILICFVSGIPLAEQRSAAKANWAEYKRQTSALLPWPPKK